jgi:hypothetical protein
MGNRSLHQTMLRRNNTLGRCCQDPGIHYPGEAKARTLGDLENVSKFPGEAKARTFGDLENYSKSERLKISGGGVLLIVRL